jgi:hypothetical protein
MIRVYEAANLQDAHIVLGLLAQARIEARVFNQHAQGGLGDIPFGEAYPSVWIEDARDQERARKIIDDYQLKAEATGTVRCSACGEESPGNFAVCWNCGARL